MAKTTAEEHAGVGESRVTLDRARSESVDVVGGMGEFALGLLDTLDFNTVTVSALSAVVEKSKAREAAVWLADDGARTMKLRRAMQWTVDGAREQEFARGWTLPLDRLGTRSERLTRGEMFVTDDYYAWLRADADYYRATIEGTAAGVPQALEHFGSRGIKVSLMGVPLQDDGRLIGCLTVLYRDLRREEMNEIASLLSYMGKAISLTLSKGLPVEGELRRKTELERALEARNAELTEAVAKLRQAREAAAKTHEYEKQRLSWNLHDNSNQLIAAVLMRLRRCETLLEENDRGALSSELAVVRDLVGTVSDLNRDVMATLSSKSLEEQGLEGSLLDILDQSFAGTEVSYRLNRVGDPRPLNRRKELAVFRIAQEAVQNARRHASASSVVVMLRWLGDGVKLAVTDDGCGVDGGAPGEVRQAKHYGMQIMAARAESVEGLVKFANLPDGGFRVEAFIPY